MYHSLVSGVFSSAQVAIFSVLLLPICIGLYTEYPVLLVYTVTEEFSVCFSIALLNCSLQTHCSGFGNEPHLST